MTEQHQFDVIIIGSGLGGLACGALLAREGYSVCVLERNKQIGGTLQTYARDKIIFDSGVHYVGALDKGQNLYKIFKFLGIMDKLKIKKMDEDMVDGIIIAGDPKIYKYAQGYDKFIKNLAEYFPDEEPAIRAYCEKIKEVCSKFPLYNLREGDHFEKTDVLQIDAQSFVESLTPNKKLQTILLGTNLLYAGYSYKTPFYVHALVVNSYIESSWRCVDGGSQIARLLAREITSRGGVIKKHVWVKRLVEEGGAVRFAEDATGQRYLGKHYISNVNPAKTMEMLETTMVKKVYRNRLKNLENSISVFYLNISLKKDKLRYKDSNIYCYGANDAFCMINYTAENWPNGYALFYSASSKQNEYADGVTIMAYMRYDEVKKWGHTFNTVTEEANRGEEYESFKRERAERLLDYVDQFMPELKPAIKNYYVATPLTLRDYVGTDDGNLYGFVKDCQDPLKNFISPRTKIPNLFLTGQNLNLHGVLGVSISSLVTCSELLGRKYILDKIAQCQE